MPSVRAMRLARRQVWSRYQPRSPRFNALGAGDEARERAPCDLQREGGSGFNALGAGDEARERFSAASSCRVVSGFNALGAGDKAREADLKELQGLPITTFQCPRCGR